MNDLPNQATVQDYACRWGIKPMFSDFKSRGGQWEGTPLRAADRLDRWLLIMALAMYGCVRVGQEDTRDHPPPRWKKTQQQTDPDHWAFRKLARSAVSWFTRGLWVLERRLQMELSSPPFYRICPVMRN